ncbi:MAG: pyridoxal 5'-phosphate synthase lyase subunit PdxS, partial [Bacillota bacterium]
MKTRRQTMNESLNDHLKGGVIMDVINPDQAKIAETA